MALGDGGPLVIILDMTNHCIDNRLGQALDIVGAAKGIDHITDMGFLLDNDLGVS